MTAPAPAPRPGRVLTLRFVASLPFLFLIRLYQLVLSPVMGAHCRHYPTCSVYAMDAYLVHGPVRGTLLTLRRILRCHPWGTSGYDPVPPAPGPSRPIGRPSTPRPR